MPLVLFVCYSEWAVQTNRNFSSSVTSRHEAVGFQLLKAWSSSVCPECTAHRWHWGTLNYRILRKEGNVLYIVHAFLKTANLSVAWNTPTPQLFNPLPSQIPPAPNSSSDCISGKLANREEQGTFPPPKKKPLKLFSPSHEFTLTQPRKKRHTTAMLISVATKSWYNKPGFLGSRLCLMS